MSACLCFSSLRPARRCAEAEGTTLVQTGDGSRRSSLSTVSYLARSDQMSAVCHLDVPSLGGHTDLGMEDTLCGGSAAGLYPSDDTMLPWIPNEASADSSNTQLLGLESTCSQSFQQLCFLEGSRSAPQTVVDAARMYDATGLVDPSATQPFGMPSTSDMIDFAPLKIKGNPEEGGQLSDPTLLETSQMLQPESMKQVLYGMPMDNVVPVSQYGHSAMMSDPMDQSLMMSSASMGLDTCLTGLAGSGEGLLEPSLTNAKMGWGPNDSGDAQAETPRADSLSSKSRWKPNSQQLCLLEQHFKSGYTKATPELFTTVQGAGPATEAQVSVWLKNRLARCKRQPKGGEVKTSEEGCSEGDTGSPISGSKRERDEGDDIFDDFSTVQSAVFEELSSILAAVDSNEATSLARAIRGSRCICCYGVGREGLVMKGLASHLHHLGFQAYSVGDTSTPTLGKSDLFLVSAGPSYYSTVSALSLEAMRSGARVIAFTAHKTAPLPFAERVIRIASQTLPPCMPVMNRKLGGMSADIVSSLPEGKCSVMQMGASFEMSLSLLMECVCIMLQKKTKVQVSEMRARHTNLE